MTASASEVRQFAVAACAWSARQDPRTTTAFTQAKAMVVRAFAGDTSAMDVIEQIPSQAAAIARAQRLLREDPMDTSADGSFKQAVQELEASTSRLISLTKRRLPHYQNHGSCRCGSLFRCPTRERNHMGQKIIDQNILDKLIRDIEDRQIDEVETAGLMYQEYAELGRIADRGKNRAKKRLNGYSPGRYGDIVLVLRRVNREYADMDKIAETYAKHGLGPVPMKPAEATLRVEFATSEEAAS